MLFDIDDKLKFLFLLKDFSLTGTMLSIGDKPNSIEYVIALLYSLLINFL
jgi:hypothetical protein